MAPQLFFILGLCTLGLCGHMTSALTLPRADTQSSESTSTDEKSDTIRASLYRLQNYLYDLKEKLDRVRQLYDDEDVFGQGDDDRRVVVSKRKPLSSGFYGVRGRRAEEEAPDMADRVQEHGNLMGLLEYYRGLHNNKRTMLGGRLPGNKRYPPPRGFIPTRGRRSVYRVADITE